MLKDFIPSIWSARLISALEAEHVLAAICNRDHQSEFSAGGDETILLELGQPAVSAYVEGSTSLTYENIDVVSQTFKLDQSNSFSFELDDISKSQMAVNPINIWTSRAAKKLVEKVDDYIAALWTEFGSAIGTTGGPTAVNSKNVVSIFTLMAKKFDLLNVSQSGRFACVSPWLIEKIRLANITTLTDNASTYKNGEVGNLIGFSVRVSTNLEKTSSEVSEKMIFGVPAGITYAETIKSVEALRNATSFRDQVRGLHLWGAKVVIPNCMGVAHLSSTAEV